MSEAISLFDVIKRGGFEASLFTTFNASLPFYEEVVLRRLIAAGCQQNIVLMDHRQCAASWQSEATRPRLAGAAYSLIPVKVPGAFHPKVCILVGKKRASVLVGSHNLTLSGFGYNREVTNWMHLTEANDHEGGALLYSVWTMVQQWIKLAQPNLPPSLVNAVLDFGRAVAPLSMPGSSTETLALHQVPGDRSLIEQVGERIKGEVRRIGVTGAFFDSELEFIQLLSQRWPSANIVVAVDPDTVYLPSITAPGVRFVDARLLWSRDEAGKYLHAKLLYLELEPEEHSVLISGSANPSRPAWMGRLFDANVEAVILRSGREAQGAAQALGLLGMFTLASLSTIELEASATRSIDESRDNAAPVIPLWIGVASNANTLHIASADPALAVNSAALLTEGHEIIQTDVKVLSRGTELEIPVSVDIKLVRACELFRDGERVAQAMIAHPQVLGARERSHHRQVRDAIGALDPSGESISEMLIAVENAIFDRSEEETIEREVRSSSASGRSAETNERPKSLEISVDELGKFKRRPRMVESADIVTLIDLLRRKLGEGLQAQESIAVDAAGRTEEEQVDQEDGQAEEADARVEALPDAEIAGVVARRMTSLVKTMLCRLEQAAEPDSQVRALIQLIAVLLLVKELYRIERLPRWKMACQYLVREEDRRRLLDESLKFLFSSGSRRINVLRSSTHKETDEAIQLHVLLLWLAWSLGHESPELAMNVFDTEAQKERLHTKAIFLALTPALAVDGEALAELERYVEASHRQTPVAASRARNWLRGATEFGQLWSRDIDDAGGIKVGDCCLAGDCSYPRLVARVDKDYVDFWEFDGVRRFQISGVLAIQPSTSVSV